ncbi:UNVERIFIED_CONTAM: hypothetical protein GTU68_005779, partial [Idotea baltica]|nr:hypothetical protein [Idotea baltica]
MLLRSKQPGSPSLVRSIRAESKKLETASDEQLKSNSLELVYEIADGLNLDRTVARAFGLAIEASRRTVGQVHYDVQIVAGIELLKGNICEMKTGEGKTLSAIPPLYVMALQKRGCHLATANDYLAERDSEFARPIFKALGFSTGTITGDSSWQERFAAYRCDVTYGTAKEFGFDFLRDEMAKAAGNQTCIPSLSNILIDEADSLLIDEARTPLIIGAIDQAKEAQRTQVCNWAEKHAQRFLEGRDFKYHEKTRRIEFLPTGVLTLRGLQETQHTRQLSLRELGEYIENTIRVYRDYHRDQQYAVVDGEIMIIDEFTGRPAEGRQWQKGIHQAVEAKENLEITPRTERAASITVQALVNQYDFICGMTGTAWTSRKEFRRVYKKRVVRIPTHRPSIRKKIPTQVFATEDSKFQEIAKQIKSFCLQGRSVLVGTRTLDKSEQLSACLTSLGIAHNVLNANQLEKEAALVADAGLPGRVTVATNMAGRGTDISL